MSTANLHAAIFAKACRVCELEALAQAHQALERGEDDAHRRYVSEALYWRARAAERPWSDSHNNEEVADQTTV